LNFEWFGAELMNNLDRAALSAGVGRPSPGRPTPRRK